MRREALGVLSVAKDLLAGSRPIRAGLFEPPPKMVSDISAWVLATAAYRANVRQKSLLRDYEAVDWSKVDFDDYKTAPDAVRLDDWEDMKEIVADGVIKRISEKIAYYNALVAASPKPVKLVLKKDEKAFKIDLTGWKYLSRVRSADPNAVKEANRIYPSVKVTIVMTDDDVDAAAAWYIVQRRMEIVISPILGLDDYTEISLRASIEHELGHFAQDYLARVTGASKVGYPPEGARTPDIEQRLLKVPTKRFPTQRETETIKKLHELGITQESFHDLDDVEFYTVLRSTIEDIRENLVSFDESKRRDVLHSMMGTGTLLRGAYPPKFIVLLKKYAPLKWRKAVIEITKALT